MIVMGEMVSTCSMGVLRHLLPPLPMGVLMMGTPEHHSYGEHHSSLFIIYVYIITYLSNPVNRLGAEWPCQACADGERRPHRCAWKFDLLHIFWSTIFFIANVAVKFMRILKHCRPLQNIPTAILRQSSQGLEEIDNDCFTLWTSAFWPLRFCHSPTQPQLNSAQL